jgi:predicted RND superfamily exporter protein
MAKAAKKNVTRPKTSAAKYSRSSLVRVASVAEAKEEARLDADETLDTTDLDVTDEEKTTDEGEPEVVAKKPVVVPSAPKRVAPAVNTPNKVAAKNAVAAQAAAAQAAQSVRRGKATVRANMPSGRPAIRAENYSYVVKDLRFIAVLAVLVVIIMIVLRIVIKG